MIGQTVFRNGADDDPLLEHALEQVIARFATIKSDEIACGRNVIITEPCQAFRHLHHTRTIKSDTLRYVIIVFQGRHYCGHGQAVDVKRLTGTVKQICKSRTRNAVAKAHGS